MKKNQIYGIAAISLGILLFIPLLLAGYAGKGGGSESFFKMLANFTATGTPTFYVLTAVFTILLIIAIACLLVTGIMLLLGIKTSMMYRMYKYITYTTGGLALAASLSALLLALTYKLPIVGEKPFKAGVGAIILLILSLVALAANYLVKMIAKKKQKTETSQTAAK